MKINLIVNISFDVQYPEVKLCEPACLESEKETVAHITKKIKEGIGLTIDTPGGVCCVPFKIQIFRKNNKKT